MNAVVALVVFAVGWNIWTWYGRQSRKNSMDKPLIFRSGTFHLAAGAIVLLCFVASFVFFYRAQPVMVVLPPVLFVVLTVRLMRSHRLGIVRMSVAFVDSYSEAIKNGHSVPEAKEAAYHAIGEAHLFGPHVTRDPLHATLFRVLRWQGHIPPTDEDGWAQQVEQLVEGLLSSRGLAPHGPSQEPGQSGF